MNSNFIFIILIICFEFTQAIPFNSFTQEFLFRLIPFSLLVRPLFIDKIFTFFDRRLIFLLLFNFICFLSLFWTTNVKYTLATLGESNLAIILIIFVLSYVNSNSRNHYFIVKIVFYTVFIASLIGIPFLNQSERTILGLSPSTFSEIAVLGCVTSVYLYQIKKNIFYLITLVLMLLILTQISSIRGVFSIGLASVAYLNYFHVKNNILFFKKFFMLILLITLTLVITILFIDFSSYMSFVNGIGRNNDWIEFKILDRLMINIMYFQKTFNEIIFNNNLDMTNSWGSGNRLSGIVIGIKETIENNPLLGVGFGNSKDIFFKYGKETYSHNAFVELFIGTGFLGLIPYCYFLYKTFTLRVSEENIILINWKRFSSIVFLVFCMFGLPYESLSLSILLGLIISL